MDEDIDKSIGEVITQASKTNRFNNYLSISKPPSEIVKLQLVQARFHLLDAYEDYEIKVAKGYDNSTNLIYIRARLKRLLKELMGLIDKAKWKDKDSEILFKLANSDESSDVIQALDYTLRFMEFAGITKIDVEAYDYGDPDMEDQMKGL